MPRAVKFDKYGGIDASCGSSRSTDRRFQPFQRLVIVYHAQEALTVC